MITLKHSDGHTSQHCLRTVHSEMNAIAQAARDGIPIKGATLYCKMTPCQNCAKVLINSGIVRVVAQKRYQEDQESITIFELAGVPLEIIEDEVMRYEKE